MVTTKASFAGILTQRVAIDFHCDQGPIRPVSFWEGENKIGIIYMAPSDQWRMTSRTGAVKWYSLAVFRSPSESGRWGIGDCLKSANTLYVSEAPRMMKRLGLHKVG